MWEQFLEKTSELLRQGNSFAVATVVRALPPTSGKPGDKAIIQADGKLWGWIGGGCAQPVVAKEALKVLADGSPRLVRISPVPNAPEEGTVDYTMTCHSGGALEIYIEPVLPKPHLVILGRSPVAKTLAQISSIIGYAVTVVLQDIVTEGFGDAELIQAQDYSLERVKVARRSAIIVSTQGEGDEEALEQALRTEASYIAFVASKTKAQKVFEYLKAKGASSERLSAARAPAGIDIHAKSPEEIAVSILAQLIQVRGETRRDLPEIRAGLAVPASAEAKDPICGMAVNTATAKYRTEYRGQTVFFCCLSCKQMFDREPARYSTV